MKGTVAVNIFIGIIIFFLLLTVVTNLKMRLLSLMLGSVAGIGLIGLMIIFQPEIRRFLLMLGDNTLKHRYDFFDKIFKDKGMDTSEHASRLTDEIVHASKALSKTKTGGLMILTKSVAPNLIKTGKLLDAKVSSILLENLFFKNAPLHDGAVIIAKGKIQQASAVLPISNKTNLPKSIGLRHRAAIGATENAEVTVFIVSEETGNISVANKGKLKQNITDTELTQLLLEHLSLIHI